MDKKIKLRDFFQYMVASVKVSLKIKGITSLGISFAGLFVALVPLLISGFLQKFTDSIFTQTNMRISFTYLALLIFLYLLQTVYNQIQNYFLEKDKYKTEEYIKQTLIDISSSVEYQYIENQDDFQQKLLFAERFGGNRVAESMQQLLQVFRNVITVASVMVLLWNVNFFIVIIVLAAAIPSSILSFLQKDEEYKTAAKNMEAAAMSVHLYYIASGANERCKSLPDLRFNGIFQWVKNKWKRVSEKYLEEKKEVTRKYVIYNIISDILRNSVYVGVLLITAWQIYRNPELGVGLFILVYSSSSQLQNSINNVVVIIASFASNIHYIRDFFELQETPQEPLEDKGDNIADADISYRNVNFSYPGSDRMVLKNINIDIKQGEKIAIVGHNGSGKSTFINLLCGLYKPVSGSVKVTEKEVYDNLYLIRKNISVIFQNFGKYETTIRDNITLSDINKVTADEEINSNMKKSGIYDLVNSYPDRLDETIGSYSESGNDLSGGQWQKLALTRAIYRDNARIMILDEPTSALDPIAEAELYKNFSDITGDRTTILISHRLGVTSIVDRILLFHNGEIIADGNHGELIQTSTIYREMYEAQRKWYEK